MGEDDYFMFKERPQVGNYEGLDEILNEYIESEGVTQTAVDGRMKTSN